MSTPADKKIKTWQRAGAVVLALSVWQAASWAVGSALLLPGPVTVLGRLCALAVTAAFRRAVAFSFCRIAGGFALALVLAFVLALAAGRWPVVEVLLRPYVLAIKAVPVASFIILALIWMRTSALPLFISFLMVFPILYTNVLAGLRSADSQLLEMARAFRVPWRRQLHSILLPAVAVPAGGLRRGPGHELEGRCSGRGHRCGGRLPGRETVRREDLPPDRRPAGLDRGDRGDERPV